MARIPIGLELYSVREEMKRNLPGTLSKVAKMGYEGVEFAGYYDFKAQDLRNMLDALELKCCSTHTPFNSLLGDALPATLEFNKTLGNKYLIVPALPKDKTQTKAGWLETAKFFNELAKQVEKQGFLLGYHNHYTEFQPLEGELPWDVFFSNTDPSIVMQLDTGNAMRGGGDPLAFLKKYPGRAKTIHLKEYSKTNPKAFIGQGETKWQELFGLCETVGGTEWYIVEEEGHGLESLDCVEQCLKNLRQMGK